MHPQVPNYTVHVSDHILTGIQHWTPMQREGFLKESEALGYTASTRTLRHVGGKATWIAVSDYHMTFTADRDTQTITILAARPCKHRNRKECWS